MKKQDKQEKHEKETTKTHLIEEISLPFLSTEANQNESLNTINSNISTKNKNSKTNRLNFKKLFTMKEEERLYKLTEMNSILDQRNQNEKNDTNESLVGMKRMWDAYPSKTNVLQDIRKQFSTYAIQAKLDKDLPTINKSQSNMNIVLNE